MKSTRSKYDVLGTLKLHQHAKRCSFSIALALAFTGVFGLPGASGASAKNGAPVVELSGGAIVEKMLEQDPLGFGGAEARVAMTLVDERKNERKRTLDMLTRKDGKVRRSFVRFSAPADIAGTAFLSVDESGSRMQQIYMPALARTRRIASNQRNGRFVGTDYSYADLDLRDLADATKKRLPDETIGAVPTYVVEALPTDKGSEYARIVVWVSKQTFLPVRIRYFDAKKAEIKRLTAAEFKNVSGRWIIVESKMVDIRKNHTTAIKVLEIKLRKDVPLDQFTAAALERE